MEIMLSKKWNYDGIGNLLTIKQKLGKIMKKEWFYLLVLLFLLCSCQKDEIAELGWEQVSSPTMNDKSIMSLEFFGNSMFAVTNVGFKDILYKSENKGLSWEKTTELPYSINSLEIYGKYIFVGTGHGVYRSSDNGVTWDSVNDDFPLNYGVLTAGFVFVKENKLYCNYCNANVQSYVYTTDDYGDNWKDISFNIRNIYSLVTIGSTFIASSEGGIYKLTDGGKYWSIINNEFKYVKYLAKSNGNLVGGYDGFYYSKDNGVNWVKSKMSDNYQAPNVECIINYSNNLYSGTQVYGVYYSSDNGITWSKYNDGFEVLSNSITVKSLIVNENYIYAGTNGDGIWRRKI